MFKVHLLASLLAASGNSPPPPPNKITSSARAPCWGSGLQRDQLEMWQREDVRELYYPVYMVALWTSLTKQSPSRFSPVARLLPRIC